MINRCPGSGRPSVITDEAKELIEAQMLRDDETTALQLHRYLTDRGFDISLRTVLCCRTSLGWTFRGSAYCQLIRNPNKVKRLAWARDHLGDGFDDVIWTDESTIQMETHDGFAAERKDSLQSPSQGLCLCSISIKQARTKVERATCTCACVDYMYIHTEYQCQVHVYYLFLQD